jgi:CRP/FNR family transcriptional regulator, transcriptional activator FtrB
MPESEYPEIRKLDLFAGMADESFRSLMRGAYVQNFPAQIELITEGEPSDFLHIVLSGSVDLFSQWNGRETSMATVRPISTFILAATIKGRPLLDVGQDAGEKPDRAHPGSGCACHLRCRQQFRPRHRAELAQCYRSVIKTQKDLKLRTSLERLANYLLRQQRRAGGESAFQLEFEKRRLASVLGMTPENLSRAFKGLQPYGVTVKGTQITIGNQADLEQFAKPSPLIDG